MKVAVAVIYDEQGRILIAQRPLHAAHGGMWEFPGGKLEPDELAETALIREIKEEVGIDILDYSFLGEVVHHYGSKMVNLLVFTVKKYLGIPFKRESQLDLQWVEVNKLFDYSFPEANTQIIELIEKDTLRNLDLTEI
ncbi:8-oxo-dGTP diphosphatase MutT [Legionella sp.]|uniref:8-oxo-dGTP diphosphatase MutT n=1 Tax=Legionella sp. TaxID=459 RepID=UPI000CA8AD7C|nr:8-oxo-dGTP diphosphatase MutT [Legionella sp.]PJE12944.1 MAG: 8-oxo-dGTP diphosphatase MutT [Legionella sp.]